MLHFFSFHLRHNGNMQAWLQTGNPEYGRAFDSRVTDWTSHNLPAPASPPHELTVWRTLEAGIRAAGAWGDSFFGKSLSSACMCLVWMMSSWIGDDHDGSLQSRVAYCLVF